MTLYLKGLPDDVRLSAIVEENFKHQHIKKLVIPEVFIGNLRLTDKIPADNMQDDEMLNMANQEIF